MTIADHRKVMKRCISKNVAIGACVKETFAGGMVFSPLMVASAFWM